MVLMSALTLPTTAHADDAAFVEAKARFDEGVKLWDAGKYEEARLKYLQALQLKKFPAILLNLSLIEAQTGRNVEAIEHAREFVKLAPFDSKIDEAVIARQKEKIADLLKKVGQIEVEAPQETHLNVDDHDVAEFPKEPIPVSPGKHTVRATLNGKTRIVTVTPAAGEVAKASFDFAVEDKAQPPPTAPPPAEGEPERTTLGWAVPIGLGVLGVGGIVFGGAFASAANSSRSDLDKAGRRGVCASRPNADCTAYEDKGSTMNSQRTMSFVGYGVGGVALAAAVVTFFVLPKGRKESPKTGALSLTPIVDPHHTGAHLELQF
jgi:hypothetical protein